MNDFSKNNHVVKLLGFRRTEVWLFVTWSRTRANSNENDRAWHCRRDMGDAAELSSCFIVDADTGEDLWGCLSQFYVARYFDLEIVLSLVCVVVVILMSSTKLVLFVLQMDPWLSIYSCLLLHSLSLHMHFFLSSVYFIWETHLSQGHIQTVSDFCLHCTDHCSTLDVFMIMCYTYWHCIM